MNERHVTRVAGQLKQALGEDELTRLGRETGFTERLRNVTPFRLTVALVGAMASRSVETIADLQRSFHAVTGRSVKYKPFHNQLAKESFPVFMLAVFEGLLGRLAVQTLAPVRGQALSSFKDIVLQDGSSFAMHDALQAIFPGRFTATSPAAVELHATMSVLTGQPLRVSIAPDAQGERDFLPEPEDLTGMLFLADRGYMDVAYCRDVAAAGGAYVIRFTRSANPVIVGGTVNGRRIKPSMFGRSVNGCADELKGRSADLDVACLVDGERVAFRLVLMWNEQTKDHMRLATNLRRRDFRAKAVRCLYRLRWQVELLFKEWKSYANLKPYCTRKAPIAEGLIWAALCAALLKRYLASAAQALNAGTEISTRIVAMSLSHHLPRLIDALIFHRSLREPLETLLAFLASSCQRAHPRRDRVTGRLASGLRPVHGNAAFAACVAKD